MTLWLERGELAQIVYCLNVLHHLRAVPSACLVMWPIICAESGEDVGFLKLHQVSQVYYRCFLLSVLEPNP